MIYKRIYTKIANNYSYGLFFLLLIILDQYLKIFIIKNNYYYICNNGISFNIGSDFHFIKLIVFLFFITFLFIFFLKKHKPIYLLPILFILAGSFSNIIDRLYFGCVIDFIRMYPFNFIFFNIADTLIFIGTSLMCLFLIKNT